MLKFTPLEYLKIDIANAFGKDKLTWGERLQWYEDNKNNLDFTKADEPARACAGIDALEKTLRGEPTGFMCAMDATISGVQLLSIMLGSRVGCILTNAIHSGERVDGYTYIYEMTKQYAPNLESLTRQNIKDAVMQYFYGGSKTAKDMFGEEGFMIFELVLSEIVPDLVKLRNLLLDLWNPNVKEYHWTLPDNFHVNMLVEKTNYYSFKLFDEEYSFGITENAPVKKGDMGSKALGANITHSVDGFILREMCARCMYNQEHIDELRKVQHSKPNMLNLNKNTLKDYKTITNLLELGKQSGYYSVRILDYLNKDNISLVPQDILDHLLDSLPKRRFDMMTIHDCFFAHANYIHDVREQYRNCLVDLSKSNLLEYILKQVLNKKININKPEDLTNEIAQEEYAIC